jgi:hypothetical protein
MPKRHSKREISASTADPNRFLIFGITYLLATPSQFAQEVVDVSDDLDKDVDAWLKSANVGDPAARAKAVLFVKAVLQDPTVYAFMNGLRTALQGRFSVASGFYDGHQCPIGVDSQSMIGALAKLK